MDILWSLSSPNYWRNTSQWSTEGSEPAMHHEKLFLWFGTLREMLWPMKTQSSTCLFGLQHANIGVLPYHGLLTTICDNCRFIYVFWMRERVHVYTEGLICTQSYNMLQKLKTLLLFIKLSFPSYLCSDYGQAAYLIGRFSMLYIHAWMDV